MRRAESETVRRALPPETRPAVDALLEVAAREGFAVHLVGGPVRDYLLGRPLRDVDVVVEPGAGGGAPELARRAAPPGARVVAHERFGTARVEVGKAVVDVATARSERYPRPGALPEVAPGTLLDDLRRRDFTANALAIPLTPAAREGRPTVVDPGSGMADLRARRLRVFHPRSFHDDPTRALRAARLAPRLGFAPARGTLQALRAALRDGAFGGVTGERFRAELEKLFADAHLGLDPSRALRLLDDWHVLASLEPGLYLPAEAGWPLRRLGRAVAAPPWTPEGAPPRPLVAGLMAWLAPLAPALRGRLLRRIALRGDVAERILAFPRVRDLRLRALGRGRGRAAVDAVLRGLPEEELLALHAWAPPGARRRIERWAREDRRLVLPVGGDDLLAVGLAGPAVGEALERIRAAVLDRSVRSREDALALARELARRPPRKRRRD